VPFDLAIGVRQDRASVALGAAKFAFSQGADKLWGEGNCSVIGFRLGGADLRRHVGSRSVHPFSGQRQPTEDRAVRLHAAR
jgi:hypothetical protein